MEVYLYAFRNIVGYLLLPSNGWPSTIMLMHVVGGVGRCTAYVFNAWVDGVETFCLFLSVVDIEEITSTYHHFLIRSALKISEELIQLANQ